MRRALPAAIAAILVVAGTVVTRVNATASPVDTYRTTTVTTGSVEQRLNLTGSVERVNQVSESFPAAGTVTSVPVSVGDTVTEGQTLANLNTVPLQSAVTSAKATLAKAKATLESDQTASTSTASAASSPTGSSSTGSSSTGSSSTGVTPASTPTPTTSPRVTSPSGHSGSGQDRGLTQAQQRVTSAQRTITADLGRASAALAKCLPFFPSASAPTGTPTSTPSTSSTATAPTTTGSPSSGEPAPGSTSDANTPSAAQITACIGALRTAPTQQQIQRDQQALTRSQTDLMTAVTLAITTAGSSGSSGSPGSSGSTTTASHSSTSGSSTARSTSGSAASQSSGSQQSGSQSSGGQTGGMSQSGATRVVTDQAAVTQAAEGLVSAQADLTSATLKSSVSGTVGSVTLVKGVSSSGLGVVIVGAGAVEVTVNVPLASIASVRVGQSATVTPQGATSFVPGAVTSISLLPSTTSSSSSTGAGRTTTQSTGPAQSSSTSTSPTYPVVVLVPDPLLALASGSRAEVSLLIGTAKDVVTVPSSALTPIGNGQAVAITIKNGAVTRSLVKTGFSGTFATQITSGLTKGQQVVLADLSTALPTNTTNSRRFGVGGGAAGGLGGASLGGAGLGGAGFAGGGAGFSGGGGGFAPRG